jgi:hypothetical protein
MKRQRLLSGLVVAFMLSAAGVAMGAGAPIVHMRVTLPDGETREVTAPESGLATLRLKDGTPIGVRPTIEDSQPWTHVVVTIFETPTTTHASKELGEVEVKTAGSAAATKTTPAFKVAVTSVTPPTS